MINLKSIIREVSDFPIEGISFKDITTLLMDPAALEQSIQTLTEPYLNQGIDLVVGIESRGFIFGVPMATRLNAGFIPIRKPGKLPYNVLEKEYELEYGTNKIAIHEDSIKAGQNIVLVDDLLATGGTMAAAINLVEQLKANIVGLSFLIELDFLNGRDNMSSYPINSLIHY